MNYLCQSVKYKVFLGKSNFKFIYINRKAQKQKCSCAKKTQITKKTGGIAHTLTYSLLLHHVTVLFPFIFAHIPYSIHYHHLLYDHPS